MMNKNGQWVGPGGVPRDPPEPPMADERISEELKPCPFCSERLVMARAANGDLSWSHPHMEDESECPLSGASWDVDPKWETAWNRRAAQRIDKERMAQIDYGIDLQRIIEDLCADRLIRTPQTTARHHYDMAVAAQARRAEASPAMAVKPLEWVTDGDGHWKAAALVGTYHIIRFYDGRNEMFRLRMSWSILATDGDFDTFDEAKAAAQADFNQRILSALSHTLLQPQPTIHRGRHGGIMSTPTFNADDDLLDLIETAIDDSMDMDWTSRLGAEHVLRALKRDGYLSPVPLPDEIHG